MLLTRHGTTPGPRWALDGNWLAEAMTLSQLLQGPASEVDALLRASVTDTAAEGPLLAPIDDTQEVWASGVTYLRFGDGVLGRQPASESAFHDVLENQLPLVGAAQERGRSPGPWPKSPFRAPRARRLRIHR